MAAVPAATTVAPPLPKLRARRGTLPNGPSARSRVDTRPCTRQIQQIATEAWQTLRVRSIPRRLLGPRAAGALHLKMEVRWELPREVEAPFRARQVVRELTEGLRWRAADVVLVVSELVTNSVRHAVGAPIELRARRTPDALEVEVCDPMPGFDPPTADMEKASLGEGGVGLAIVDVLADDWGIRSNGQACVWARFEIGDGARPSDELGSHR